EDAASFATHVEGLPIRGIDNYRSAEAHRETGEPAIDTLPSMSAIGAAEDALCSRGCVDSRGVAGVHGDCPCRRIQNVGPGYSAILGQIECGCSRSEQSSTLGWIDGQV